MGFQIGTRNAHRLVSLSQPLRRRLSVPGSPLLVIGSLLFFAPFALAQQENMPPETVAPALRHSGPHPGMPAGNAYPGAPQQGVSQGMPLNHRRGVPPNVVTPPTQQRQPVPQPVTQPAAQPATQPTEASPEAASLLQLPPNRAQVKVVEKSIAVQADNSSLSQVLRDIGTATGMKVEGLSRDERIFGSYGPGAPRDVITALLDGAGYNVMMVGEIANGAPRQLILSQRNGSKTAPAAQPTKSADEDDTEPDAPEPEAEAPPPPPAVVPAAAQRTNIPGADSNGVRTPQQLLEQLQKMHQDQPPQQQQPPQDLPPN